MKTLQNNFTTPEQSKILLALGVPKDSADCFYYSDNQGEEEFPNIIPIVNDGEICFSLFCDNKGVPCWSAGRLMEIIDICVTNEQSNPLTEEYPTTVAIMDMLDISFVEYLVRSIAIAKATRVIDYSKLED